MRQRKDGRYEVKVFLGTVDGKKKYKSIMGKSPAEVNRKVADLRVRLGQGVNFSDSKSFSLWADRYLSQIEPTVEREWYQLQKSRAEIWKEEFGDISVEKIKPADCQDILNEIAKCNPYYSKPTSYKTLKEYKNILCRIFDYCVQNRILTFNSANYLIIPKTANKGKRMAISNTDIQAFMNTEHKLQTICLVMIYAGLRRGEATCLRWDDIDFKNNVIHITKSADLKENKIKEPKTAAGVRTVPMPEILCEHLMKAKKESLLVLSQNGRQFTNTDWAREWKSYLRKIETEQGIIIDATIHCLRHTYCTLLYEAGIDVLEAKEFMGHSDIQTTLGIYTHLRSEKRLGSVHKLDELLSPKDEPKCATGSANVRQKCP